MSDNPEELKSEDSTSQIQENLDNLKDTINKDSQDEDLEDFSIIEISDKDKIKLAKELALLDPEFDSLSDKDKINLADELGLKRENTRSWLAKILMLILFLTVSSSVTLSSVIIFLPPNESVEQRKETYTYSKDILALLLSTQTTLIGTVLGFYFGSMQKNS